MFNCEGTNNPDASWHDEDSSILYLENLIRCGDHKQVLDIILEWKNRESPLSEHFTESLDQLSHLARFCLDHDIARSLPQNTADSITLIPGLIERSVQLGLLELAEELAGNQDTYHLCDLIQSLYAEGYVELAKSKLLKLNLSSLLEALPPYKQLAYIYGEVLHDEGRFDEAAPIFERLAEQFPDLAKARFAASSCYLHTTMNRLVGRLELYRPGEEEQNKIEKYLTDISEALHIIHGTNWHTTWSLAQSRNLPTPTSNVLH